MTGAAAVSNPPGQAHLNGTGATPDGPLPPDEGENHPMRIATRRTFAPLLLAAPLALAACDAPVAPAPETESTGNQVTVESHPAAATAANPFAASRFTLRATVTGGAAPASVDLSGTPLPSMFAIAASGSYQDPVRGEVHYQVRDSTVAIGFGAAQRTPGVAQLDLAVAGLPPAVGTYTILGRPIPPVELARRFVIHYGPVASGGCTYMYTGSAGTLTVTRSGGGALDASFAAELRASLMVTVNPDGTVSRGSGNCAEGSALRPLQAAGSVSVAP